MLYTTVAVAIAGLSWTASAYANPRSKPECVDKCWTNTQYVSQCAGDHQCLCEDAEFQNAVYQCLYSQCSTSKFGTALHYTLQACKIEEEETSISIEESIEVVSYSEAEAPAPTIPAFFQGLKKRNGHGQSVTCSNTRPTRGQHSVTRTQTYTRTTTRTRTATLPTSTSCNHGATATYPTGRARPASVSASQYQHYPTSRASPTLPSTTPTLPPSYPTTGVQHYPTTRGGGHTGHGGCSISATQYLTYPTTRAKPTNTVSPSQYQHYPTDSPNPYGSNPPSYTPTTRSKPPCSVSASQYMHYPTGRARSTASSYPSK